MPDLDLEQSIAHNFLSVVQAQPDALAICATEGQWTYAELYEYARRIAVALSIRAPDAGGHVALLFEHGRTAVASILGVALAGRSYLPVDAAYPTARIRYMLQDSGARVLLHDGEHTALAKQLASNVDLVIDVESLDEAASSVLPTQAGAFAYLLYTSGSTGVPKGVAQTPRNLLHHIDVWVRATGMRAGDRVSLQSAYGWDSAMQDTFSALLSGATLVPVRFKQLGLDQLLDVLRERSVTIYHSTVPIFRAVSRLMRRRGIRWPCLRVVALGGDAIHAEDLRAFEACFEPGSCLLNSYGATESSSVLMNRHDHGSPIASSVFPVGRPVLRTRVELAKDEGREGEILVSSDYIAPGYWSEAPRNDPRFVIDAAGRVIGYRTGDLSELDSDGNFVLRGRFDRQAKIDGMRVDPNEVEAALRSLPEVSDAIVMAAGEAGDRVLVAYVVPSGHDWDGSAVRNELRRRLPPHCIPGRWIALAGFPLNAHGKLDHGALASLDAPVGPPTVHATNMLERAITEIWSIVLDTPRVGVDQNFFDLGGSSLKLAMVASELKLSKGIDVSMTALYRHPTVRALAAALSASGSVHRTKHLALERGARRRQQQAKTAAPT